MSRRRTAVVRAEGHAPPVRGDARGLMRSADLVERFEAAVGVHAHEAGGAGVRRRGDEDQRPVPRCRQARAAEAPVADRTTRHAPQHGTGGGRSPAAVVVRIDRGREDLAPSREDHCGRRGVVASAVRERQRTRFARLAIEEREARVAVAAAHRVEHVPRADRMGPAVRRLPGGPVDGGQRDRVAAGGRNLQEAGRTRTAEDDRPVRRPGPACRLAAQEDDRGRRRRGVGQRRRPERSLGEEPHGLAVRREEGLAGPFRPGDDVGVEAVEPADVEACAPLLDRRVGDPAAVGRHRHVEEIAARRDVDRHCPPRRRAGRRLPEQQPRRAAAERGPREGGENRRRDPGSARHGPQPIPQLA